MSAVNWIAFISPLLFIVFNVKYTKMHIGLLDAQIPGEQDLEGTTSAYGSVVTIMRALIRCTGYTHTPN